MINSWNKLPKGMVDGPLLGALKSKLGTFPENVLSLKPLEEM